MSTMNKKDSSSGNSMVDTLVLMYAVFFVMVVAMVVFVVRNPDYSIVRASHTAKLFTELVGLDDLALGLEKFSVEWETDVYLKKVLKEFEHHIDLANNLLEEKKYAESVREYQKCRLAVEEVDTLYLSAYPEAYLIKKEVVDYVVLMEELVTKFEKELANKSKVDDLVRFGMMFGMGMAEKKLQNLSMHINDLQVKRRYKRDFLRLD